MSTNTRMNTVDNCDPGVGPGLILTGSTQTVDPPGRYLVVSTGGTLTGQMVGDTSDKAYVFPVGTHFVAVKSVTSTTTLVGFILR